MGEVINIGMRTGNSRFPFLEKDLKECDRMLRRYNNYIETRAPYIQPSMAIEDRVLHKGALSHISAQLTSALAWLYTLKAIDSGELEFQEVLGRRYRLQEVNQMTPAQMLLFKDMPAPLPELVEASTDFYLYIREIRGNLMMTWNNQAREAEKSC